MAERESVYLWSTSSTSNGAADPSINFAEGQLPGTLNNSNRSVLAAISRFIRDINGSKTTAGSSNAYTLTISGTQTAYATGQIYSFRANHTNTGTATLNVTNADGAALGAKQIRYGSDLGLAAGLIVQSTHHLVQYHASAVAGGGGFMLINPVTPIGPGSTVTDNAAVRFDGTTGAVTQESPLIIADTTGALSRNGGGGIPVQGTNTTGDAPAGFIGEVVSSSLASGSAVPLVNNTAKTVTSISLTAGDWDVSGVITYRFGGTTTCTEVDVNISSSNDTFDVTNGTFASQIFAAGFTPGNAQPSVASPVVRKTFSATATAYLIAFASFGTSVTSAYGAIRARRVR